MPVLQMTNIDMRRYFFFLVFWICFTGITAYCAPAKPVAKAPAKIQMDTAAARERSFSTKQINTYLKDPDFKYNKADVPGESLWTRFWRWFWKGIRRHLFASSTSQNFFYYLLIALGIAFLIFIILKITGITTISIFRKSPAQFTMPFSETTENIHGVDFEVEIEKAVAGHNYRLAVRFLYLYSLKQLNDTGLIDWQLEKTNYTYYHEIPPGEKRQLFGLITRQFEYVWYGNFNIDATSFNNINVLFKQFKQQAG